MTSEKEGTDSMTRRRRPWLVLLLLVVALATLGAACGGDDDEAAPPPAPAAEPEPAPEPAPEPPPEPAAAEPADLGTLALSYQVDSYLGGPWAEGFEALSGNTLNFTSVAFPDVAAQYATVLASQDPTFDLLYGYVDPARQFGDTLYLELNDVIPEVLEKYPPHTLGIVSRGDQVFCIPFIFDSILNYYRTDLFEQAGISDVATTWEGYIDQVQQVMETEPGVEGIIWPMGSPLAAWFLFNALANAAGAEIFDLNADALILAPDDPAALAAMQTLADLGSSGVLSPSSFLAGSYEEASTQFATGGFVGQPAFVVHSTFHANPEASNVVDLVGAVLMPGITNESGSVNSGDGLCVSAFSENQEQALDFLRYAASEEAVLSAAEMGFYSPQPLLRDDPEFQAANPLVVLGDMQAAVAGPLWITSWSTEAHPDIQEILINVAKGDTTPEEGVQEMVAAFEAVAP